jgi:hypothetical protein
MTWRPGFAGHNSAPGDINADPAQQPKDRCAMTYARLPALFAILALSMPLGGCVAVPMAAQAVSGLPMFAKQAAVTPDRSQLPDPRGEIARAPR